MSLRGHKGAQGGHSLAELGLPLPRGKKGQSLGLLPGCSTRDCQVTGADQPPKREGAGLGRQSSPPSSLSNGWRQQRVYGRAMARLSRPVAHDTFMGALCSEVSFAGYQFLLTRKVFSRKS